MDVELTITQDVAAAKIRGGAQSKTVRPVRLRLWSEAWDLNLSVPGPAVLARFVKPRQEVALYRRGRTLLAVVAGETVPQPVSTVGQAEQLSEALRGLPVLSSESDAYKDLRQAAEVGGPPLDDYLRSVVREFVRMQDEYAEPKKKVVRGPARTDVERQHASRLRQREEAPDSVRWAISAAMAEGDLQVGERVAGPDLHRRLAEFLEAACDEYERMVSKPHPDHDREFAQLTMSERREAWEVERHEWELSPPRRPRRVTTRALYKVLRSPALGWQEFRVSGVTTFLVAAGAETNG